jgi:hypothetical protein
MILNTGTLVDAADWDRRGKYKKGNFIVSITIVFVFFCLEDLVSTVEDLLVHSLLVLGVHLIQYLPPSFELKYSCTCAFELQFLLID